MNLGEYIRQTRIQKKKSLTEFAGLIGKTPPFLYDIEMGRRHPSDEVLALIAQNLGDSLEKLKEYDTRPPTETIRRRIQTDPQYALAFRKMFDAGMTPAQMMSAAEKVQKEKQ